MAVGPQELEASRIAEPVTGGGARGQRDSAPGDAK
jgi:hypothetical protein